MKVLKDRAAVEETILEQTQKLSGAVINIKFHSPVSESTIFGFA